MAEARARSDQEKREQYSGKGRPSDLTPSMHTMIIRMVEGGVPLEVAAAANGIHRSTLYNWKARGRANEQPFADFLDAVNKAEGRYGAVQYVKLHEELNATGNPNSRMALLERKGLLRPQTLVHQDGGDAEPVSKKGEEALADLPAAELEALLAEIEGVLAKIPTRIVEGEVTGRE
jgi:hypothetical protein